MIRRALLLGLFSTAGQILLLRELVSSLNGDELFIGTALFGWLIWVAVGASLGGKARSSFPPSRLFAAGGLLLPLSVLAARLSPLLLTDTVGEAIAFSSASLVSIAVMLPVGMISGWLFTSITREWGGQAKSIIEVYLFEGIGACIGGVIVLLLTGSILSTLGMAITASALIAIGLLLPATRAKLLTACAIVLLFVLILVGVALAVPQLDLAIDGIKYRPYRVAASFDTQYSHQTILLQESSVILLTDNTVEAVYPDLERAENLFLPPLVYKTGARQMLYIGRTEFGVSQLAEEFPDLSVTSIDPRRSLDRRIAEVLPVETSVRSIGDDPVAFFTRRKPEAEYDIITVNLGELSSYKSSRLLTERFLSVTKASLRPGGVLYVPTHYDTDGHISPEKAGVLAVVYNSLRSSFAHVIVWPGSSTLLFASDSDFERLPYDSLVARISQLPYRPQFISDNYLNDRLSELKVERLRSAVSRSSDKNSITTPIITLRHTLYRAKASSVDRAVTTLIFKNTNWVIFVPALILIAFAASAASKREKRRFALFLYFVAGSVSLTLELVSFYVYQSFAGSLYSEMAALIGAFMLGLAFGAYFTYKTANRAAALYALVLLVASALLFLTTYRSAPVQALLLYHVLFLFVTAVGTGSLFVAATNRYYRSGRAANVGLGYGCELVGSSVGALLPMTVLLPLIGLHWLLLSIVLLLAISLLGLLRDSRGS